MKLICFLCSRPIHAADDALRPICGQTDGHKARRVQQIIADGPTCSRCRRLLALSDKNSPAARARRRYLAARQALRDGRAGIEYFEKRTTEPALRRRGASLARAEIRKLAVLARKLGAVTPPQKVKHHERRS